MPKMYLETQKPGSHEQKSKFHELAELEVNDAAVFFEIEQVGLGYGFCRQLKRRSLILENIRKPHH